MQKRVVLINAGVTLVQIVVVSGMLFFLYHFLLKTIGVEQLGIWSLVLATTSLTNIANFGLSGSVVKFVAKYIARGENERVLAVIQTAVISLALITGVIIVIGYPVVKLILQTVIPENSLQLALSILPFALFSLWLTMIIAIFRAGIDGHQLIYVSNILTITGSIFFFLLCLLFAPRYGLIGLAYAQIIQNLIIICSSWIILKRLLPRLPFILYRWDKDSFKEIIGYGTNFQIISITAMLYDPTTKALISKFGGLSMVGYYEMASRMVQQLRALIVSANSVLVPTIADLQEKAPERIKEIYLTSYQLLFYLALPLYSFVIISVPLISEIWIGHYERIFVLFGILLAVGWFLNTLASPAYFVNLGIGELRWNVISHIAIAILNAGFGLLLGIFFGGMGVVIAWIIAISLGSSIIYLSYHVKHKIPLVELIPEASRKMVIVCLILTLLFLMTQNKISHIFNPIILNALIVFIFSLIMLILLWFHPMRTRLLGWITVELLNKRQGVAITQ